MPKSQFVTARDGVQLHVRLLGSGRQHLIVPGTGNEADFVALTQNHNVVFFDIRNRGRSTAVPPDGHVGVPIEIDDIEQVRAHFGLERCNVFGWSYVALIAALYAAQHPERVDRLVLACPPAPRDMPRSPERSSIPQSQPHIREIGPDPVTVARTVRRATARRMMAVPDASDRFKSDPGAMRNEWPAHVTEALARVSATFPADFDLRPQLTSIDAVTLVLHGEHDATPLASSREVTASIPNARLLVIGGVGHFPHVERPDGFFGHIDTFLSGAWPEDAQICE